MVHDVVLTHARLWFWLLKCNIPFCSKSSPLPKTPFLVVLPVRGATATTQATWASCRKPPHTPHWHKGLKCVLILFIGEISILQWCDKDDKNRVPVRSLEQRRYDVQITLFLRSFVINLRIPYPSCCWERSVKNFINNFIQILSSLTWYQKITWLFHLIFRTFIIY